MADVLAADMDERGGDEPVQTAPYLRQRWRDAGYSPPSPDAAVHDLTHGLRCDAGRKAFTSLLCACLHRVDSD